MLDINSQRIQRQSLRKACSILFILGCAGGLSSCGHRDEDGSFKTLAPVSFSFWSTQSDKEEGHTAIDDVLSKEIVGVVPKKDLPQANKAQVRALNGPKKGATFNWNNRRSNLKGEVTSGPVYYVNSRQCREYTHTIVSDSNRWNFKGTACKTGDEWFMIN
ncbi:hypothetical protein [Flexibacterium corallicola]|uniref:hypothetical protein n=1 Tax=Flexibacterium corallicola TaxID=3037259 RepID=UPI00286F4DFC|nr:hypothetical protein [Pseudovibrio sp. M1P-2-3]